MLLKKIFKEIWERLKYTCGVEVEIISYQYKKQVVIKGQSKLIDCIDEKQFSKFLKEISLEFTDKELAKIIADKVINREFQCY